MTSSATHQHRRLSRIPVTAGAAVLAIGLLTTGSVLYSTDNASAVTTPTFSTFSRAGKPPQRLRLCHRRSLTPIANSFLGPVTEALDTMPNDPIGEGLARYGLQHSPHRGTMSVRWFCGLGKWAGFGPPFSSFSRAPYRFALLSPRAVG